MSEDDSSPSAFGRGSRDDQKPLVPLARHEIAISKRGLIHRGLSELESILKSPVRLLLVDDFDETRRNLKKLFAGAEIGPGIEIIGEAETGDEGIRLYGQHIPDVVLTNVHMPIMDGVTMAQRIIGEYPGARILFLSVDSEPSIIRMAVEAGASGYLVKPPNSANLVRLIYEIARQSGNGNRFYFDDWMSLFELEGDFVDHEVIRLLRGWSRPPVGPLIDVTPATSGSARYVKDLNFAELTRLDLSSSAISDAAGPTVGRALNLNSLSATHTRVTDDFLSSLSGCRRLESLNLADTAVGFSRNSVFSSLGALERLYLARTNAGDEFMLGLSASRQLRSLDISNTAVGITGLSVLPHLTNLTSLTMSHMERNLGDLRYLAELPKLSSLYINGAQIDNGGLRNLAQLRHLKYLGLEGVRLAEKDIDAIASIKGLKWISLRDTRLGIDASKELQRRLPSCEIRM